MKAKIYTKSGDAGQTSLVGGSRVAKTDARLEAYGTLDELNSVLGILRSELTEVKASAAADAQLSNVQNALFVIGSHLACENEPLRQQLPALPTNASHQLEIEMDTWENDLPPLRNFILPGGHKAAALAHLARTVCRRAERATLHMHADYPVDTAHLIFLNRLSDWLFLLARKINVLSGNTDVEWKKP